MIIEQSELDAAIAAIRDAFGASPSAASSETGPARLIKRLEELIDVPRDQWPPSALAPGGSRCAIWPITG